MHTATAIDNDVIWQPLCRKADLVAFSGVAAWLDAMKARPRYQKTYYSGARPSENYPGIKGAGVK